VLSPRRQRQTWGASVTNRILICQPCLVKGPPSDRRTTLIGEMESFRRKLPRFERGSGVEVTGYSGTKIGIQTLKYCFTRGSFCQTLEVSGWAVTICRE